MRLSRLFAIVSSLPFLASHAHSAVLIDETFSDGNFTGYNPPTSIAWISGAQNPTAANAYGNLSLSGGKLTLDHTLDGLDGTGAPVTYNSHAGIIGYFAPSGSPATIATGETLRLTFTVSYSTTGAFVENGSTFRWGLFNSSGVRTTTSFANASETGLSVGTTFSGWKGYSGDIAARSGSHTSGFNLKERTGTGNGLFTSSNWSTLNTVNVPANTSAANTNINCPPGNLPDGKRPVVLLQIQQSGDDRYGSRPFHLLVRYPFLLRAQ